MTRSKFSVRSAASTLTNSLTAAGVLPPPAVISIAPLPRQQQHHQHNIHTTSELSNIYTIILYVGLPKANKTVHLHRKRLPLCHFYYTLQ